MRRARDARSRRRAETRVAGARTSCLPARAPWAGPPPRRWLCPGGTRSALCPGSRWTRRPSGEAQGCPSTGTASVESLRREAAAWATSRPPASAGGCARGTGACSSRRSKSKKSRRFDATEDKFWRQVQFRTPNHANRSMTRFTGRIGFCPLEKGVNLTQIFAGAPIKLSNARRENLKKSRHLDSQTRLHA